MRAREFAVPRRVPDQRGSASVLGVVLVGVLAAVTLLVAVVGGVVADQRRAESAADLGALAGAAAVQQGADGCAAARPVVRLNGARLAACSIDGAVVWLRAIRSIGPVLGRRFTVSSTARAGPADFGPG